MVGIAQTSSLYDHPAQFEPLVPDDNAAAPLLELAHDLQRQAQRLLGQCQPGALRDLRTLLRAMNSYYSNKIEGQHTLPIEIEQALRNDYATDPEKARKQRLAVAHIRTEQWLHKCTTQDLPDLYASQTLVAIHLHLFEQLTLADRLLEESEPLQPGAWRDREVRVGRHGAPTAASIEAFVQRWHQAYSQVRRGEAELLAVAASHHRLAWVHPFRDGNGRVARLHTHFALERLGLSGGLWSPLRGFARSQPRYYEQLDAADAPRAGDLDGRGNLSQRALVSWIEYVLEICLDQVQFMTAMLDLASMKDRIAACLSFEQAVVKQGVREEALRPLHYLFATQSELDRADFKAMTGLGDRLSSSLVSALVRRELVRTDSPYGRLRFGVPLHALRFYFPALWPEAEASPA
ncbi:MAG: Fic family protein [Burkholderiaceae bacterium]|nr:Fic family protein [Burkholderiaceae bacterium]